VGQHTRKYAVILPASISLISRNTFPPSTTSRRLQKRIRQG